MKEAILDPPARLCRQDEEDGFYRRVMERLNGLGIPFLVGGTHMFERYTGIARNAKDFDIHVRRRDASRTLQGLSAGGYRTERTFPHWLGKVFDGEYFVDVIFSSGNGVCKVDDAWFEHAEPGEVLGVPVKFCPPEETIWSKAFIMERERYDGADVVHLLRACAKRIDWPRLLWRFDGHWRVLLSHLILFGFIYPAEQSLVPRWILEELLTRLQRETESPAPELRVCQGTLFSRLQYLADTERWQYLDARLAPGGTMTPEEVAEWTAAADR